MRNFIAFTVTTILLAIVGVFLLSAWSINSQYNELANECGDELNKTCFVVVNK